MYAYFYGQYDSVRLPKPVLSSMATSSLSNTFFWKGRQIDESSCVCGEHGHAAIDRAAGRHLADVHLVHILLLLGLGLQHSAYPRDFLLTNI